MDKNKKQHTRRSLFLLSVFSITLSIQAKEDIFQSYDTVSFFDQDTTFAVDESFNAYLTTRACSIDPLDLITILTGSNTDPSIPKIYLQKLTEKNLYKRTNPSTTRPIVDLPYFQRAYCNSIHPACEQQTLECAFFFNQTKEKYFYQQDNAIKDYIGLFGDTFNEFFEDLSTALKTFNPQYESISIPKILDLFGNIKLEERRAGALFTWGWKTNTWSLQAQLPIYYIEHNFMLTEKEQNDIGTEPFIQSLLADQPANDPNAVNKAIREHVAEDLFGAGDLKITLLATKQYGNITGRIGPEIIFPSACVFTDKLIGGRFETSPKQPEIDFSMFACGLLEGLGQKETDFAKQFGIGIIERLARITGNTSLGQNYLGLYLRGELIYEMTPCFCHRHMVRIGTGTPYITTRFFNENKVSDAFNRDYTDATTASENLRFLENQFVSSLYPLPRIASIQPGPRLEYRGSLQIEHWAGLLECGYDFWFQGAEQISLKDKQTKYFSLNSQTSRPASAFENKIFASLTWQGWRNEHHWSIGLFGDYTFYSQSSGNDWSCGFSGNIYW
jgi:hypothetical protein